MNPDDAVQRWISESDNAFTTATPIREGPYESWETTEAYPATEAPLSFDEGESFDPFRGLEVGGPDQREGFSEGFTARADQWNPEAAPPYGMESFTEVVSEEPQEGLASEMFDEQAVTSALMESAFPTLSSYDVASEQFVGMEHKTIGDAGSGGTKSILMYGDPPRQLTFGEVVALSGDYFETYKEMTDLSNTQAGRKKLAYARWHCLTETGSGFTEPEPTLDEDKQKDEDKKKEVRDRYYYLASVNLSHFREPGGTAWTTYTRWHWPAILAAFEAGSRRDPQQWLLALTLEAFADHYLTDSFSAGHVRTPRQEIRDAYLRRFPSGSAPLVRYMARHLLKTLLVRGNMPAPLQVVGGAAVLTGGPLAQYAAQIAEQKAREVIEGRIRELGGEAIQTFTLGDIVSKALHDYDNKYGLVVLSDVDASGKAHPSGYTWKAMGDAHLTPDPKRDAALTPTEWAQQAKWGLETRTMAVAAVAASIRDLQKAREAGVQAGPGPHSKARVDELVRQGTPRYEARRYVPREKPGANPAIVSTSGSPAPLEWRWGKLGRLAYTAVDDTVKRGIADELRTLSKTTKDSVSMHGMTVRGIRVAVDTFAQQLENDGIKVLEAAMGEPSKSQ
jgi:hypothetical protein